MRMIERGRVAVVPWLIAAAGLAGSAPTVQPYQAGRADPGGGPPFLQGHQGTICAAAFSPDGTRG
jgi:hypothetical protein